MSLTKYARLEEAEVLGIAGSPDRVKTASLNKFAEFDNYRTEDGYLYARIRAISSRVNKNHDGWPSIELAGNQDIFDRHTASQGGFTVEASEGADYGFSTFLGKPIFVDHHNHDPERARGVIVDAKLHVEDFKTAAESDPYYASAPENHTPPTWVELLLEVDAKSFPHLAAAIVEGSKDSSSGIDGFSMGCDVEESVCSICKNAAHSPEDYCSHVKLKGATFDVTDERTGSKTSRKAYEDCYGIKFFEISAVFDPADETALLRELVQKEGSVKTAENPLPQADMLHKPEDLDTLRQETVCPVCGSTMDDESCEICGYVQPPEGFDNPDLEKAKTDPLQEPGADLQAEPNPEPSPGVDGQPTGLASPDVLRGNNPGTTARVTDSMAQWEISLNPRIAGRINVTEKPITTSTEPETNEPQEQIVQDETQPVTSSVRTAKQFIEAAGRGKEQEMSESKTAAEPVPAAKPDKRVDVEGVGGVDQASNEEASRADAQVDVEGQGGTGVEDVSADQEGVNVDQGDEHSKNIDGTDTKTWSQDNGTSPVGGDSYPSDAGQGAGKWSANIEAAKQGTDPVDPVAKADDRVDVEQEVSVDWGTQPSNWTGTDGNGVTRQQDPVTRETLEGNDIVNLSPSKSSAHIFSAVKLADLEVEVGLTDKDEKFERMVEIEGYSPETVEAVTDTVQKIKSKVAAIRSTARVAQTQKLPSLNGGGSSSRTASTEESVDTGDSISF